MASTTSSRTSIRPGLSVTPRASPLVSNSKLTPSSLLKSPSRSNTRDEQNLILKQVIGTTTSSGTSFDSLQSPRCFAFTAGGAAVVATIHDHFQISQQVFRAKPASNANSSSTLYDSPTFLGASQGARTRTAASLRDAGLGILSFGSSHNDSNDSPSSGRGGGSAGARERTKAATCVSLSADGKLVAVGETGYKPRVLIFSLARDTSSDTPLSALSEHTFGVRCVAFSPDSQYLASLGDANDGFLYIWSVNQRSGAVNMHANNKCTSNVRQMVWVGSSLITIGTRHVKVWRIDDVAKTSPNKRLSDMAFAFASPSSKALSGRNCLLGPLLDKVFIAACAIAPNKAVVCTESGDVCILHDDDALPQLTKFAETGFSICSVALHAPDSVIVAGTEGQCTVFPITQALERAATKSVIDLLEGVVFQSHPTSHSTVALGCIGSTMVVLDSQRNIELLSLSSNDGNGISASSKTSLPAHGGAVLGVQSLPAPNPLDASFLTWSAEGSVMAWGFDGVCRRSFKMSIEQPEQGEDDILNELRVARCFQSSTLLITADKLGIFRISSFSEKQKRWFDTRAHQGEITNVAIYEKDDYALISTCGRDRMLQLFKWNARQHHCELIQTLDEHAGAVTGVMFSADGKQLLSCSSDRTVVVRDVIAGNRVGSSIPSAYVVSRTITLKATPLSMELISNQDGSLLVPCIDRQVLKYDFRNGNLLSSFKATDTEGGDSVIMGPVIHIPLESSSILMAGVSSTDKSIRVYSEAGKMISRDYGHTEGMSGIALVQDGENSARKALVTGATDGTIFIWALPSDSEELHDVFDAAMAISPIAPSKPPSSLSTRPPLRKVLSTSDLIRLQGRQDEADDTSPSGLSNGTRAPRRRASKVFLLSSSTPRLDPSPLPPINRRRAKSPVPIDTTKTPRRTSTTTSRNNSPPSPKRFSQTVRVPARQSSLAPTAPVRRKSLGTSVASGTNNSTGSEFNALASSTEQICRNLRAFRKKLATSSDVLPLENVRELERELSSTARSLSEKASRNETVMVKLLDQYSERLVGMLEERIESSVARRVKQQVGPGGGSSPSRSGSATDDDDEMPPPERPRDRATRERTPSSVAV